MLPSASLVRAFPTPASVSRLLRLPESRMLWHQCVLSDFTAEAVAGSGTTGVALHSVVVSTAGTAGSTARRNPGTSGLGWSKGKAQGVINWSKAGLLVVRFNQTAASGANGVTRVLFGRDAGEGAVALDEKGVGFEVRNLALWRTAHDGSTLGSATLSTTLTAAAVYTVSIVWDGAGTVRYYLDGVLKGTSTGGPTGDSTTNNVQPEAHVLNGADAADHQARVHDIWLGIRQ